jgi:AraC-like DNA-binding protein
VKRRAGVVGIFPNEASITRLIGAVLLEQNDEWLLQCRHTQIDGMAELIPPLIDADPAQLPPIAALTGAGMRADGAIKRRHARIMIRFEEVLAERLGEPLHMTELCDLIGVTEWTLRSCCAEFLGMSPIRYVLLRRLSRARVVLRDAAPDGANLSELVRGFGFAELGRFEAAYRTAFGETPLTTLQRAPGARFINP